MLTLCSIPINATTCARDHLHTQSPRSPLHDLLHTTASTSE